VESEGGIIEVGDAFAQALKERGIPVIHDRTSHVPHDSMAYDRSRRTAVELLKKNPIALLDIHRDAVPKEEYTEEVNNTTVSKIQFVVGRQNPNQEANDSFARQIKEVVDRKYPGLVKGIFYGKGKYNQDLAPRLILIEVGTHTNTRQEAERGAAIFASAAQEVLARPARTEKNVRQGFGRSFLWIIGVAVAGIAIFLVLNGGWNKIRSDVGRMTGGNAETNSEPGGEDDPPREE
jgi:stage II sporulation protein P